MRLEPIKETRFSNIFNISWHYQLKQRTVELTWLPWTTAVLKLCRGDQDVLQQTHTHEHIQGGINQKHTHEKSKDFAHFKTHLLFDKVVHLTCPNLETPDTYFT